jgi:hypothetical protein
MLVLACRCGGVVVRERRELYSVWPARGNRSLDNTRKARPSPGPVSSLYFTPFVAALASFLAPWKVTAED